MPDEPPSRRSRVRGPVRQLRDGKSGEKSGKVASVTSIISVAVAMAALAVAIASYVSQSATQKSADLAARQAFASNITVWWIEGTVQGSDTSGSEAHILNVTNSPVDAWIAYMPDDHGQEAEAPPVIPSSTAPKVQSASFSYSAVLKSASVPSHVTVYLGQIPPCTDVTVPTPFLSLRAAGKDLGQRADAVGDVIFADPSGNMWIRDFTGTLKPLDMKKTQLSRAPLDDWAEEKAPVCG